MTAIETTALIVGGGPAGSTVAMRLLERGVTPLIVERAEFPRYHIGESMTGECGALVRSLGFEDAMLAAGHPHKEGVVVFGQRGNPDWWVPMTQRTPDMVLHEKHTWQVRRSVFDTMLLDGAVDRGAELVRGRAVAPIVDDGRVRGVQVDVEGGGSLEVEADLTFDCSGQATFLANKGATGPKYMGSYDKQIAIFSQVRNYVRDDGDDRSRRPGNTHIFYTRKYHWAWAIPLDDEITSVGIVVPAQYFRERGESKNAFVARELHELNPGLRDRVPVPELVEPAHVIPNYSFQVRKFAGPGYICVGDAHRFVDPIFSFGLYVAIREAGMAVEAAMPYLEGEHRESDNPFHDHMVRVEQGVDVLEDTIDTFWENPLAFARLVHKKYREPMIDVFSGRIFADQPHSDLLPETMATFRRLLGRERTYDDDGMFSMPIGSRYHPERAPIWRAELDQVDTTEAWIRDLV